LVGVLVEVVEGLVIRMGWDKVKGGVVRELRLLGSEQLYERPAPTPGVVCTGGKKNTAHPSD
jgi:hypothetical protein